MTLSLKKRMALVAYAKTRDRETRWPAVVNDWDTIEMRIPRKMFVPVKNTSDIPSAVAVLERQVLPEVAYQAVRVAPPDVPFELDFVAAVEMEDLLKKDRRGSQ